MVPEGGITLTPYHVRRWPEIDLNPSYRKTPFIVKLHETGFDNDHTTTVMEPLGSFTRKELNKVLESAAKPSPSRGLNSTPGASRLADSNHEMNPPKLAMSERILFRSPRMRATARRRALVRFTEDDGR